LTRLFEAGDALTAGGSLGSGKLLYILMPLLMLPLLLLLLLLLVAQPA